MALAYLLGQRRSIRVIQQLIDPSMWEIDIREVAKHYGLEIRSAVNKKSKFEVSFQMEPFSFSLLSVEAAKKGISPDALSRRIVIRVLGSAKSRFLDEVLPVRLRKELKGAKNEQTPD